MTKDNQKIYARELRSVRGSKIKFVKREDMVENCKLRNNSVIRTTQRILLGNEAAFSSPLNLH
jgi:hypothetical protein